MYMMQIHLNPNNIVFFLKSHFTTNYKILF